MSENQIQWPPKSDSLHYDPDGYGLAKLSVWITAGATIFGIVLVFMSFASASSYQGPPVGNVVILLLVVLPLAIWSNYMIEAHKSNVASGQMAERHQIRDDASASARSARELESQFEELKSAMKEIERNATRVGNIVINGANAAIVIGSGTINIVRSTAASNPQLAEAMKVVVGLIESERNEKAGALFDQFAAEAAKESPNKTLLSALWDGLVAVMPTIKSMADVAGTIAKLFA